MIVRRVVGGILLLAPRWSFSSSFGAWWGDSLTRPALDSLVNILRVEGRFCYWASVGLSRHHSARGGEILLLTACWFLSSSFGAWWGDSLTQRVLDSSHRSRSCLVVRRVGSVSYTPRAQIYLFVRRVGSLSQTLYTGNCLSSQRLDSLCQAQRTKFCLVVCRDESFSYTPRARIYFIVWWVGSISYTPRAGICSSG